MYDPSPFGAFMGVFGVLYFIFVLLWIGVSIYLVVLFVKLARRGIKALDIYIKKNQL